MSVKKLIHGLEMCALLDLAAQRNVLPLQHFDSIPVKSRLLIQPSTTQVSAKWLQEANFKQTFQAPPVPGVSGLSGANRLYLRCCHRPQKDPESG